MSSLPGCTLEDYVSWDLDVIADGTDGNSSRHIAEVCGTVKMRPRLTDVEFASLVKLYEPYRERVEDRLCDFDEDTQSWRDYAGYAFDFIPEEVNEKARAMIDSTEVK